MLHSNQFRAERTSSALFGFFSKQSELEQFLKFLIKLFLIKLFVIKLFFLELFLFLLLSVILFAFIVVLLVSFLFIPLFLVVFVIIVLRQLALLLQANPQYELQRLRLRSPHS